MPFRPHRWFGKPRRTDKDNINGQQQRQTGDGSPGSKPPKSFLAIAAAVALAAAVAVPQAALADDHWRDEIDFEVTEPVEGRRLFVEGLTVSGDRAAVTLRAATPLDLRVRAFGGPEGSWLRFWGSASLDEGERIDYSLPLHGPSPSFTFSWEDTLGQAGAVTVEEAQLPVSPAGCGGGVVRPAHDFPGLDARRGQRRHRVGVRPPHPGDHPASDGGRARQRHRDGVDGRGSYRHHGDRQRRRRRVAHERPVRRGRRDPLPASRRSGRGRPRRDRQREPGGGPSIPLPPLVHLTHHPARVEHVTRTVHLHRPGDSDSDSDTATATCEDGATSSATATAYAYVPSATIAKQVTVDVQHKEHVKAETVERSPIAGSRDETLALASSVGADDPFEVLVLPEPEPVDPPAEQTPAGGGLSDWFDLLGWEWPW